MKCVSGCVRVYRLIPVLLNGMKYSEIDVIILKVSYQFTWTV